VTAEAYQAHAGEWADGVAAGLHALMEYVCSEPTHAHLTLVDTFGASPEAIEIRENALRSFIAFLQPGFAQGAVDVDAPEVAAEAVAGGIWQVLHHYIEQRRVDELCDAAPQLIFLTLSPFIGSDAAAEIARQSLV
jgi:hypothetical protein